MRKQWAAATLGAIVLLQGCAAHDPRCDPGAIVRGDDGRILRSGAAVYQFRKANPCPATGSITGSCPGWVVDHVVPLCACGPDTPANMQWQARAESLVKDRAERAECRRISSR